MSKRWIWAVIALLAAAAGGAVFWFGGWRLPVGDADRAQAHVYLAEAEAYLPEGNQDAALRSLNESIRLDARNETLRLRASLLVARGDFDGALRDLDQVIRQRGGLAENYSLRCWLRARADSLRGARADCDRAIEMDPALASGFGNRGIVNLKERHFQPAWSDFNAALRVGGTDEWTPWRLFGRGVAAWHLGNSAQGRQDIELALRSKPTIASEFAPFGVGLEPMRELDDAAYAASAEPRSLVALQAYLLMYPAGAHVEEARSHVAEIHAWIAEDQAAGQQTLPGFSLVQDHGGAAATDSFGAIGLSRSTWRVAFVTDYAGPEEAMSAATSACRSNGVRDCDAFAFRNVCAALAASPGDRARGMAWAYGQDDAVRGALSQCRASGGRACAPVHSQCTPSEASE